MKKTMMLLSMVVGMLALSSALASGYPTADLRFDHDTVFFPLVLFLEADTFGHLPADFDDVKNWIQSFRICMAATVQLVFYRSKHNPDDVLVKLIWNGEEASLPLSPVSGPYYKWSDFRDYYRAKLANGPKPLDWRRSFSLQAAINT